MTASQARCALLDTSVLIDFPAESVARVADEVAVEVLPFDTATAEYYGTLAALAPLHGRTPRPRRMDLQIAATAARHGLTLLTRNVADFAGLESALEVVDLANQP